MFVRHSIGTNLVSKTTTHLHILKKSITVCTSTFRSQNQVPAVQDSNENYDKELKQFQTITNVTKKNRMKKPQRSPFVKNLLLGIFDKEILTYPELQKSDTSELMENVKSLKNLMNQNHMNKSSGLSRNFRQNIADYRALGLQAPELMNGRNSNATESCALLEALSDNHLRYSIVNNELLGITALSKFGSDHLKIKYLTGLMNGDSLSAMCMFELGAMDVSSFLTKGDISKDGKNWILNGTKNFIVNGKYADVFIVVAVTNTITRDILKEIKLTMFLVDKEIPGISIKEIDSAQTDLAHVTFTNVTVPSENIIGEVDKAEPLLASLVTEYRLGVGPMCISVSKKILNNLVEEIKNKSDEKNLLHKTDLVRSKIGEMSLSLYVVESMVYLTSGLIDNFTDQDVEIEALITKVFSSEATMKNAISALDIINTPAISSAHWIHPLYQEALKFKTLDQGDENLKIILSLICLQHAGKSLNDLVNKIRNPLFNAAFNIWRIWTNRRNTDDNPKLDLELEDYLHPSLKNSSMQLEYCVKRLQFAAEVLLIKHGPEIMNQHMDLLRLADVIIDVYAMTAALGRSSRSYCIGLQNADMEIMLSTAFCHLASERVKYNVNKIFMGYFHTNDENYRMISDKVFKFKEYCIQHPLTRNF